MRDDGGFLGNGHRWDGPEASAPGMCAQGPPPETRAEGALSP